MGKSLVSSFLLTHGVVLSTPQLDLFVRALKPLLQFTDLHRESKKQDTKLLAITSLNIIRFSKFFISRLGSKFAKNRIKISHHT